MHKKLFEQSSTFALPLKLDDPNFAMTEEAVELARKNGNLDVVFGIFTGIAIANGLPFAYR